MIDSLSGMWILTLVLFSSVPSLLGPQTPMSLSWQSLLCLLERWLRQLLSSPRLMPPPREALVLQDVFTTALEQLLSLSLLEKVTRMVMLLWHMELMSRP